MKMEKYTQSKKCILFDGNEEELYKKVFEFCVNNNQYNVKVLDFINLPLLNLQNSPSFNKLINDGKFVLENSFINQYKSTENLNVYFFKNENIVFIFSFGEFQPTRYILYLESIWIE